MESLSRHGEHTEYECGSDGGFVPWTAAVGAAAGGLIGYYASDGDLGWTIGSAVVGGLAGGFAFRKEPFYNFRTGLNDSKTILAFSPPSINSSNIDVDPRITDEFRLVMSAMNRFGSFRKAFNRLNQFSGNFQVDLRIRLRTNSMANTFDSGDFSINWNPFAAVNFDIDPTTYHPSAMTLVHELMHAIHFSEVGSSAYQVANLDYLDPNLKKFWKSPTEKRAVQRTNPFATNLGFDHRVGYGGGKKLPVSNIWSVKRLTTPKQILDYYKKVGRISKQPGY